MTKYEKASRVIRNAVSKREKSFIIYPFGEDGSLVKDILNNKYGITEKCLVDNYLCLFNPQIIPLEKLSCYLDKDTIVLLCQTNERHYEEVRRLLLQVVPFNQIVDVFSNSMYFDEHVYYEMPTSKQARVIALEKAAKEIYKNGIEGSIAECGVYKGWFSNHMSRYMPDRRLYLFDTFYGFDDRDINDQENIDSGSFRKNNPLDDANVEVALANIGWKTDIVVKKGYFPNTTEGLEDERFCFVSLDTDLYKPIFEGLKFFYPRLNPGGYIFVDDLGHEQLKGVRKAVIDFCKENHIGYVSAFDGGDATGIIVKGL